MNSLDRLLEVDNLHISIRTDLGVITAVKAVSFQINKNEVLGIVGESGCGKSLTALSIMRLLSKQTQISNGHIRLNGQNLNELSDAEIRKLSW